MKLRPRARAGLIAVVMAVIAVCAVQLMQPREGTVYNVTREYFDAEGNRVDITPAQKTDGEPEQTPIPEGEHQLVRSLLVNINTADIEELGQLPGIGPVLAQRIIDYREAYGGFVDPEELMDVKGISKTTYAELEPYVTVD